MVGWACVRADQMAGYNCSYIALDHPRAFDEMLYILCCGTGVGFSCEDEVVRSCRSLPRTSTLPSSRCTTAR